MAKIRVLVDGNAVDLELAPGDYVRAERDGHRFTEDQEPSGEANACVAFHALCRAKRRGLVDVDVPATFDDFLDVFAFPLDQPDDDTGKESGQATTTG